ncbi:hypothetical protein HYH03_016819 [Edaphochlamys debaryana]|uniref:Uncharacterized protein n=1 Tax=Edaphochlamys debaryana TaxID=47281 RepID=A0A836BPS4_9CHLO|nr:hypothetical protein HYH03_016819 [Edaphochlamys debaryana]|eukprot:KAG2484405.1 hypothetical protein HYH03_016819 [Edaphochlamys debaryana]
MAEAPNPNRQAMGLAGSNPNVGGLGAGQLDLGGGMGGRSDALGSAPKGADVDVAGGHGGTIAGQAGRNAPGQQELLSDEGKRAEQRAGQQ